MGANVFADKVGGIDFTAGFEDCDAYLDRHVILAGHGSGGLEIDGSKCEVTDKHWRDFEWLPKVAQLKSECCFRMHNVKQCRYANHSV